ncbi:right-handed parallel beta-helix repeat-containing protein, partial [Pontiella sp.]|uniref:right-handed parallel beta-helix repeat-containing protein n=1 Tax=Pontiella sp. TaxID=2837462 RepID=UPI0035681B0F
FIREGTYREAVDLAGVAGSTNSPITLTAYPDETVTLDGTEAITNHWTLDAGSVYKTTVAEDVTQLFVDGELMTLARYPNAPVFSDSCWNGGRLAQDAGSSNGTVIDDALAETGVSYNDCVAIMNFGNHATGARLVENHVAGSNTFNYAALDKYKTQDLYFFEGGLNNAERVLLDTPEEWAYDESTRTLYLWADDGLDPNGRPVFAKGTNAYAIVGDADTHDIVIDGINFFATTFYLESSDRISIQNCDFDYYAASHRSLGDLEPPPTAFIDGDISNLCIDITIYNCAFRYADGGGLWVDNAENPRIENNLFQQIDYACVDPVDISDAEIFNLTKGTVPIRKSRDIVFRRNTVERAGSAQGVAISLYDTNEGRPCVLEYNYMTGCARRESDGAAFQIPVEHATHSTVRYNWFAGNHQRDLRYDGPSGGPLGNLYRNVALARNGKTIAAEGDGYACKGSGHEIYNNIGIYQECEIWTPGNAASTIRNNAADRMIPDPLSGTNSHNFAGQTAADNLTYLLRDPNNLDFRPRAGYTNLIDRGTNVTCDINGELVDVTAGYLGSAPDIGAYEFGDSAYWIPGRQEAQASMPVPRAGGQYVRTDADLMYLIGLGGESARVYFGTDPNELAFLTAKSDPENIVVLSDYAALDDNTTYYWRVDTVRADSSVVTGEVWSFTTMIDREFLPWSVRSIANADWVQDTAGSNIVYDNYDSLYSRRALVYSTHAYQSAGGFRLTVGYTAGSVDADLSHNFSFGLISTDTDLSTYAGENPFRVEPGVYSLGVHLISNGGGTMQGLNFADGSSVSNLDLSGDHVQFGTYEKY